MMRNWTFGRKVAAGFGVVLLLTMAIGTVAVGAIRAADTTRTDITRHVQVLTETERLRAARARQVADVREFTRTGDRAHLVAEQQSRAEYATILALLTDMVASPRGRTLLTEVEARNAVYQRDLDSHLATAKPPAAEGLINDATRISRTATSDTVTAFVKFEGDLLKALNETAARSSVWAANLVALLSALAVLAGLVVAYLVTKALGRQIGAAVSQVQTSASELEAAAGQQAASVKEEATAMAQITTTMNELLATSRQIADSARSVSQIAGRAASAANSGDGTVTEAHASVTGIQQQVNVIVEHMLGLGEKSQQIGAVLDLVSELAEQTNILAINATIEAASAGDYGARFGVVADEIRNLADRVAGSTKQTRDLIDEVRGAVNRTVIATETGSKTVAAGSQQFAAVGDAFRDIVTLLASTNDAAREIELSTKQQASAVEQISIGVKGVAQTTRETEASSTQTRQTAGQLAGLATDLLRLVRPPARV
jgi:methyl-accepting chemotaxis protein